jgi:hypothetical protein
MMELLQLWTTLSSDKRAAKIQVAVIVELKIHSLHTCIAIFGHYILLSSENLPYWGQSRFYGGGVGLTFCKELYEQIIASFVD